MLTILFIICGLPLWVIASNNNEFSKCNPLEQCDAYFSVAAFVEVNWFKANQICNSVGAVLATVRNEEHHQLMLEYVKRNEDNIGNKTFWLGATNMVERRYVWTWLSTGIPLTYAKWGKKEPRSDRRGKDACLLLGADNSWHSASCDGKHYFICENVCLLNYTPLDKKIYL
ncbi:dromaiocalcin-1 isoform X1 [Drosophila gunungcola]|uniref:dromaiocalcin-1 isoform X1 n=1 Tax=Drosophila gunungcola TaxID=103775 RepID=UPI0022E6DC64|nr:dromaiocalcin-1 isoform X1 [Drosophila gunungcola]